MLPLYTDQLNNERQEIFKRLVVFNGQFTLAGGTAIMLQIGHRKSFDFDCFSENPLPKNLLRKIKDVFGKSILPLIDNPEQLTVKTSQNVEVTFLYYPYKPLEDAILTDCINLYHLDDLAANKAYTIGRRGKWRDYVDLFFLLQRKLYSLDTIISLAGKKFRGEFNPKLFLKQLVYFADLEILPTAFIKEAFTEEKIKDYLSISVKDYLQTVLRI